MVNLLILSIIFALCSKAVADMLSTYGLEERENEILLRITFEEGQRYTLFPDGDGNVHVIDLYDKVGDNRFNVMTDIFTLIYTRDNSSVPLILSEDNKTSILESNQVDFNKNFKVLVHGWKDSRHGDLATSVRYAFLNHSDVNVMVIDWSQGAGTIYPIAIGNVHKAGGYLAKQIDWFVANGVQIENFNLIGHSLGAHVIGIAARNVTSGKVPVLIGLDPALPHWGNASKRIRSTDGNYVEIIHTNMGISGIRDAVGSNDFYPNGGAHQPGCGIFGIACAHKRAIKYFAETIENTKFRGAQCTDFYALKGRKCGNETILHMGGSAPKPSLGIIYLTTRSNSPFYLEEQIQPEEK